MKRCSEILEQGCVSISTVCGTYIVYTYIHIIYIYIYTNDIQAIPHCTSGFRVCQNALHLEQQYEAILHPSDQAWIVTWTVKKLGMRNERFKSPGYDMNL